MAVTINQPQIFENSILFTWSSDLGGTPDKFWVYLNGTQILANVPNTEYLAFSDPSINLIIEVFDSLSHTPTEIPGGNMTLCWYQRPGVSEWLVQEYQSGTWETVTYLADSDDWFYGYFTRFLEDGQVHRFRVSPVSGGSYAGDPLEFSSLMVRHPDPPNVAYTYNGATPKTLTVAAVT